MLARSPQSQRGDTIVEVIFSFAVFSLVIVSALMLMNQGLAMAQRSLEATLVRQQIDNQVTLVRQAQEKDSQAWRDLKSRVVSNPGEFQSYDTCPTASELGVGDAAQFLGIDNATQAARRYAANNSDNFLVPGVYAKVDVTGEETAGIPKSYGIWLILAEPENNATNRGYDLHVRACWASVGTNKPMTIGTVVRLYGVN